MEQPRDNRTNQISSLIGDLKKDPTAFGILGYKDLYTDEAENIQAHSIDNVEISLNTIQGGSYPISRPFYFYVKPKLDADESIREYINEFREFHNISQSVSSSVLHATTLVPITSNLKKANFKTKLSSQNPTNTHLPSTTDLWSKYLGTF